MYRADAGKPYGSYASLYIKGRICRSVELDAHLNEALKLIGDRLADRREE